MSIRTGAGNGYAGLAEFIARHRRTYRVPDARRRPGCSGVVFDLSQWVTDADPAHLLGALGLTPPDTREALETQLLSLIETHLDTLRDLPDAALVTKNAEEGDEVCIDLLTTVTAIAKSSDHVFMKSKYPLLSRLRYAGRIVLLVPHYGVNSR